MSKISLQYQKWSYSEPTIRINKSGGYFVSRFNSPLKGLFVGILFHFYVETKQKDINQNFQTTILKSCRLYHQKMKIELDDLFSNYIVIKGMGYYPERFEQPLKGLFVSLVFTHCKDRSENWIVQSTKRKILCLLSTFYER